MVKGVRGLDVFREHFSDDRDRFLLIGGVAAFLHLERAGLAPRATQDFDVVLRVEVEPLLVDRIWEFVRRGKYQATERGTTERGFYRFHKPVDPAYPKMLELFCVAPQGLEVPEDQVVVPVPVDTDVSSLSAILLDREYYDLLARSREDVDGLPVATPACLIVLKARAWLDLTERREAGQRVDGKNIRKHRDDVFKLSQLLVEGEHVALRAGPLADLTRFLERFPPESDEWNGIGRSAKAAGLDLPPPVGVVELLRSHFPSAG